MEKRYGNKKTGYIGRIKSKTRNVTKGMIQSLSTEEVLQHNEVGANKLTGTVMLLSMIYLIFAYTLNCIGLYHLKSSLMTGLFFFGMVVLFIPWIICVYYKGEKKWLKLIMLLSLTIVYAAIDSVMTFRSTMIMIIPLFLSSRYFTKELTELVAILSTILFGFAASFGILWSTIDLNYVIIPAGTQITVTDTLLNAVTALHLNIADMEKNILARSFIPKYLVYLMAAVIAVQIADWGYKMITSQALISREHSRVETELDVAKSIQEKALPLVHSMSPHAEFDLAARMFTAKEVGGDFYDFMLIDPTHLALIMADVSGKGVPAALFMMVSKILLDNTMASLDSPGQILAEVNHQLCEKSLEDMFVTVWLGIIDLETGKMVMANAGHENPIICNKGEQFEVFKDKHGLVLGGMDGIRYRETVIQLHPGDTIFVYTDGVPEAVNSSLEQFGMKRTIHSLNHLGTQDLEALLDGLKRDIDLFCGDEPQFDDTSMLAFRFNFPMSKEGISVHPDMTSLAKVSSYIEEKMEAAGMGMRERNKVSIAVDEMFSNVVHYSGASWAEAICRIDHEKIQIIFRDNGIPYDPLTQTSPDVTLSLDDREIGGLGIFMTKKLMSRLSYQHVNHHNEVTLELDFKKK